MSIENEAVALFEEGNPVPDLEALEPVTLDASAYLAALEQRSSEVTDLKEKQSETAPVRRNRRLLLAAAIAVAVIGTVIVLFAQDDAAPPPATEPTPTTELTETTGAQVDTTIPVDASPSPTVDGAGVTIETAAGDSHVDVLSGDEDLTITWRVLTAGSEGLPDVLALPDDGPLTSTTFLAPIDAAWLALAESRGTPLDTLLFDTAYFGFVLGYHTFSQIVLPDDLTRTGPGEYPVETATGIPLTVVVGEEGVTGFIDEHGTEASVIERVEVERGVIYAINAVLIPPGD